MKQLTFYKYAALLLLLLNLGLITFFLVTRPNPPDRSDDFQARAIELLKMNQTQHREFVVSVEKHKEQMKSINNHQRDLLRIYFSDLLRSNSNVDSILQQVQLVERQKVMSTFQHLQELKFLVKDNQGADFERFMNQVLQRILVKPPNNPLGR
ncbi:MAG: hypothetical protein IPL46_21900 [Saprospiraceae bacterium]|nr:hypothetical protein [Saprospiraceae bacterium]